MADRKRFEAWAKGKRWNLRRDGDGRYHFVPIEAAWEAYQAACADLARVEAERNVAVAACKRVLQVIDMLTGGKRVAIVIGKPVQDQLRAVVDAALAKAAETDRHVPYPHDLPPRFNGSSEPCDMLVGPCSCGAWHQREETSRE